VMSPMVNVAPRRTMLRSVYELIARLGHQWCSLSWDGSEVAPSETVHG
jgi:hypothetical protein